MTWDVKYLEEAVEDLESLTSFNREMVLKAIKKTSQNPLPKSEGGYGNPLGNKATYNLTGLLKIKLKKAGIRIIYKLLRTDNAMLVIVIGIREDLEAYEVASKRRKKNNI